MDIVGIQIISAQYGIGTIIAISDTMVMTISFPEIGEKRFMYPDAFCKSIQSEDTITQEEAEAAWLAKLEKKEAEEAKMPMEYGIILTDEKEMLSRLVKFNKETGEVIKPSPVMSIRNRTIYKSDDSYIAIAGEDSGNGAIKLVAIDPDSMEITAETDITIAKDSVLIQDGTDYYCVTDEKGKSYIAKFGSDLTLKLKSTVEVISCTPITMTSSGLVITDVNGKLKVLDKQDLSDISSGK